MKLLLLSLITFPLLSFAAESGATVRALGRVGFARDASVLVSGNRVGQFVDVVGPQTARVRIRAVLTIVPLDEVFTQDGLSLLDAARLARRLPQFTGSTIRKPGGARAKLVGISQHGQGIVLNPPPGPNDGGLTYPAALTYVSASAIRLPNGRTLAQALSR